LVTPDAFFRIDVNPAREFVEIALSGLWSTDTIRRFETDLRRRLLDLPAIGRQRTLFDLTGFIVQVKEVAAGFERLAADRGIASHRIAVIGAAPLLRMQTRRVAPDYGLFTDRAAAMEWLFADAA
jgi:hypothetical protein